MASNPIFSKFAHCHEWLNVMSQVDYYPCTNEKKCRRGWQQQLQQANIAISTPSKPSTCIRRKCTSLLSDTVRQLLISRCCSPAASLSESVPVPEEASCTEEDSEVLTFQRKQKIS